MNQESLLKEKSEIERLLKLKLKEKSTKKRRFNSRVASMSEPLHTNDLSPLKQKLKMEYKALSELSRRLISKKTSVPDTYSPKPTLCMNCELYFWSKRGDSKNNLFNYFNNKEYQKIDFSGAIKRLPMVAIGD